MRGTDSDATAAVDMPRPPMPDGADACRSTPSLMNLLCAAVLCPSDALAALRIPAMDRMNDTMEPCSSAGVSAEVRANRKAVWRRRRRDLDALDRLPIPVADAQPLLTPSLVRPEGHVGVAHVLVVDQPGQVEQPPAGVQLGIPPAAVPLGECRGHHDQRVDLDGDPGVLERVGHEMDEVVEHPVPRAAGHGERHEHVARAGVQAAECGQVHGALADLLDRIGDGVLRGGDASLGDPGEQAGPPDRGQLAGPCLTGARPGAARRRAAASRGLPPGP